MPFSNGVFDDIVSRLMQEVNPKTCLDIGAGAGKYGRILRVYAPGCRSIAIEIEHDYVVDFGLNTIYDEVRTVDANELLRTSIDEAFDLVIMGDVIEHLRKSIGLDLVHFLAYRCRCLLTVFPVRYIQNSVRSYQSEAHISSWSQADFHHFDVVSPTQRSGQELVLIRGFLSKDDEYARWSTVVMASSDTT